MSTITKERLQRLIRAIDSENYDEEEIVGWVNSDEIMELARIALASLEAEHGEYLTHVVDDGCGEFSDRMNFSLPVGTKLYTAPPAPVSVPDLKPVGFLFVVEDGAVAYSPTDWPMEGFNLIGQIYGDLNASRVDMPQGSDGALTNEGTIQGNTSCKLRDAVETIRNSEIAIDAEKIFAERDALNATDCWCRTCRPITLTDMRFVVCPDCGNKRCPHANDHRHACTGSNEPGQEGSAYPAAPQQEAKNV